MEFLIAAITLGLLGSFHCIGMCGPIALALPVHHLPTPDKVVGLLIYHIGRALVYSLIGAFFGILGMGVVLAGYQQALSIGLGVIILLGLFFPLPRIPLLLMFAYHNYTCRALIQA